MLAALLSKTSANEFLQNEFGLLEAMFVEAKSSIFLCLGDTVLAKTRTTFDDDMKSANDLWDKLDQIITASSAQAINNLHKRPNCIQFSNSRTTYDLHLLTFMGIIDDICLYDEYV